MGTFHENKHELHGITVVVDTGGPEVFIGRLNDLVRGNYHLWDVDHHTDGEGGKSKAEWIAAAAKFGVWKKHDQLAIPDGEGVSVRPLHEYSREGEGGSGS